MPGSKQSKSGDRAMLAGVVATLALAVMVIWGVHRASMPASPYPKIDPAKVHRLIDEGQLSGHKAEHFEEMTPQ